MQRDSSYAAAIVAALLVLQNWHFLEDLRPSITAQQCYHQIPGGLKPKFLLLDIKMRYLLLIALCPLLQAAIDPVKAEACVQISNDFILKDTEVGKTIAASKHPQHDTLKRLSVDVLIYCSNHIQATLAMKIVAGQAPLDAPEAKQVCKYR
jgi:hypothetical protein